MSCAAGDDAAGDCFRVACLIQYPQSIAVRCEAVRQPAGVAVLNGQVTALDYENAVPVRAVIPEHMAVQVQGDSAVDGQCGINSNVCGQFDSILCSVFQCRSQLRSRGNFCRSACSQRFFPLRRKCHGVFDLIRIKVPFRSSTAVIVIPAVKRITLFGGNRGRCSKCCSVLTPIHFLRTGRLSVIWVKSDYKRTS